MRADASAERRAAIFDALTGTEKPMGAGASEVGDESTEGLDPTALLAAVRWQLASMPTSREEDEDELEQVKEAGGGEARADPRLLALLGYRLARKRLLTLTEMILATFLGM